MSDTSGNRLIEIFFDHNENLSDKWEQYLHIYDMELREFAERAQPVSLLEIGVQNGGSLQVWKKYFAAGSRIVGIDIEEACGKLDLGENIEVMVGDASDPAQIQQLLGEETFDVIVDDGSHRSDHIVATFRACFDRLRAGGVFIIEDIHCSYMASHLGGFRKREAAIEMLKGVVDAVNFDHVETDAFSLLADDERAYLEHLNREVASISFYDSVVVVRKLMSPKTRPFRRIMTGKRVPVADPSAAIAGESPAKLREFVLSSAATGTIGPLIMESLASAREDLERIRIEKDSLVAEAEVAARAASAAADENERLRKEQELIKEARASTDAEIRRLRAASFLAEQSSQDAAREIRALKEERGELAARAHALSGEVTSLENQLAEIMRSTSWRFGAPVRVIGTQLMHRSGAVKRVMNAKRVAGGWAPLLRIVRRTLREQGWRGVQQRARQFDGDRVGLPRPNALQERMTHTLSDIAVRFGPVPVNRLVTESSDGPTISLLMPVYRTPLDALRQAIVSVMQQTYQRWELCIVDDASNDSQLLDVLNEFARKDTRIKVKIADANGGISAATNQAYSMATGDFIALFDHDDLLTHDALSEVVAAIASNPTADLFYSDECKVDPHGSPLEVLSKPDWSPLLMNSSMYIGHLSVYRRSLMERVGGFRSEFDFSQDYDFALRAMELTNQVVHIPKVLYGWRMIAASGAAGGKPYARISNVNALQSAADRRNMKAKAIPLPTANYLEWDEAAINGFVSIVIPSDNANNIKESIESIVSETDYQNWEVLVVTNSAIVDRLSSERADKRIRYIRYDKPFNFSDKCNVGAAAASGDFLIFYNDDVRVITRKWIQRILELLQQKGVGAVAPKMLYEDGTIQHAGMVTGVRRLVGTAFHCLDSQTTLHYNLAQSIREVSVLCGACIAVKKQVFDEIDGFDAVNAAISHSDVDLCFKIRDRGLTCVYTPYAELTHIGHVSIAETEKAQQKAARPFKQDKADINMLRRWPWFIADDPYFTKPMREQLFHDSPEKFQIFAPREPARQGGRDILLLAHDLTMSGAPRLLFEMAIFLKHCGHFVVVATPADGAYRKPLVEHGIPVICDELVLTGSDHLFDLAKNFDVVIGNTVLCWKDIDRLAGYTKTYLYSHESQIVSDHFAGLPGFGAAIKSATGVIAASTRAASHLRRFRDKIDILPGYGADDLPWKKYDAPIADAVISVTLIGSKESRKGQDIAVEALRMLSSRYRKHKVVLRLYGRNHESAFVARLEKLVADMPDVELGPELPHDAYIEALRASDIVLSAARDDTLPLVSLDALALGRIMVCTRETGTSDFLEEGVSGFVATQASPEAVAAGLERALDRIADWPAIGAKARSVFEENFTKHSFHQRTLSLLGLQEEGVKAV
ncbi:glycosyltransferase [Burkholderia pseudomultivorans]|uniref:glycosyltransferase n=1 Tax=Burkholderia pseudomultivorans TaxID=1207504 RepID=UPI00188F7ED1|nr:glycosyltransferase [Burkholderia pseudomultivorans]MBF5012911.1 glycosyltransferase [Burkholderia pseudomultivorans]